MNPASHPTATLRLILLATPLLLGSCSAWDGKRASLKPKPDYRTVPVTVLYNQAVNDMEAQDYKKAAEKFAAVEENYPYSSWAVHAELMRGYAQYKNADYTGAVGSLDRFIQLHPANREIAYAYYLRALCYYQEIEGVSRDQTATRDAVIALSEVVNRFPGSAYARDARLKIDLARDHLAGHEMAIGRYYEQQHFYAAALGRYQEVVHRFQTTNHVAEALARIVEVDLKLGLVGEAKKNAAVLGYNYPGSHWYKVAYDELAQSGGVPGVASPKGGRPGFFGTIVNAIF